MGITIKPRNGHEYRDVVSECLRKAINNEHGIDGDPATTITPRDLPRMIFEKYVVQELEACTL
jgi:hypothetical protein